MNFSVCHLRVKDQSFVRWEAKAKSFWKENLIIKVSSQISIFPGEILDLFVNFSNRVIKKEKFEIRSLLSYSASMWIVGVCEKVTKLEFPAEKMHLTWWTKGHNVWKHLHTITNRIENIN